MIRVQKWFENRMPFLVVTEQSTISASEREIGIPSE